MSEKSEKEEKAVKKRSTRSTRASAAKTKSLLERSSAQLVQLFNTTIGMLKETIKTGKLNPAQNILGMMIIADLMHGGAYAAPMYQRPFSAGSKSPYFLSQITVPSADIYPIEGAATWDWSPLNMILNILAPVTTTTSAQQLIAEVYANADVPHVLPKILSDEAYANIRVLMCYLAHTTLVKEKGLGITTFVEAETKEITAGAAAFKTVAEGLGELGEEEEGTMTLTKAQSKALLTLLKQQGGAP